MILVFGGTTEGKKVAACLQEARIPFVYSTKTETDFQANEVAIYRFGAFTKESLTDFCKEKEITLIIHAAHPFALNLTETIEVVSSKNGLPVIRFERNNPERIEHPLVHYIDTYEDALQFLKTHKIERLLALTGVQTIHQLKPFWEQHKAYFRILPRESSLQLALEQGFNADYLLQEMPSGVKEEEKALIEKLQIQAVITKESGESGFLETKVNAAIEAQVPILILKRTPSIFPELSTVEELEHFLKKSGYGRTATYS